MLAGSCSWGTIGKYQLNRKPKVASKAINIREVWNPVCCHGNKTGKLTLWSTSGRILLQKVKHVWYKLAEISFFIIFDQNLVEFMMSSLWLICIFLKTWISIEQTELFQNSKQHSSSRIKRLLVCMYFKMAQIGNVQISS